MTRGVRTVAHELTSLEVEFGPGAVSSSQLPGGTRFVVYGDGSVRMFPPEGTAPVPSTPAMADSDLSVFGEIGAEEPNRFETYRHHFEEPGVRHAPIPRRTLHATRPEDILRVPVAPRIPVSPKAARNRAKRS